ncbi:MAG TPA: NADH-ubiquinone oxidoreductase-F iron-sulfur binding region domain-containing protein [Streptosporangiaceae bacterium]|nr:NADH-ubiquinone oxidoreductase-F iron-sulfur binding region domain-containing protein [Streptosporangiaceae bacterium]
MTGPTRLTAGWRRTGPASLREHLDVYGRLPRRADRPGFVADAVADAGLTGRGGAGFPTGTKLRAVAAGRGPAIVVANGMEGEPASAKDRALLARSPHLVLDGAVLAAEAVRAEVVHMCLPRTSARLADEVRAAIADRHRCGLGGTPIQVHDVPHHYVSSEETSLVRWLNGGEARPAGGLTRPSERGVRRRPTLVDNVETLAHVALIARFGPSWYRQAGPPDDPGTMLATVSGAVASPGVREIAMGMPVGELLAESGARPDVAAVLIGGYFGTWHELRDVARLPICASGLETVGASPGAGVVVALPAGACGLAETARVLGYLAGQSAGQCGPCSFGLPAIAQDFAQLAAGHRSGLVLERLQRRLGVVAGRGACRHPDGAVRLASSALSAFAADVHAHVRHGPCRAAQRGAADGGLLPIPRPWAEGEWE